MELQLHKLLLRQLKHFGYDEKTLPSDLGYWQTLLSRISKAYSDSDQYCYLIERSMELSSQELLSLNKKLTEAQSIAKMGYWSYEKETSTFILSKELHTMLGFEAKNLTASYQEFITFIHPKDLSRYENAITEAFANEKGWEGEIRIRQLNAEYCWYYIIMYPVIEEGKPTNKISGVALDISERKKAQQKVANLSKQLVETARHVGMADMAVAILHNAGNVLNSAGVSADILAEEIGQAHYQKLFAVIKMIKDHSGHITEYLTQDPKGKLIPLYLSTLDTVLKPQFEILMEEITNLRAQIVHLKDIIGIQQSYSKLSGITEKIFLPEIVDASVLMCGKFDEHKIKLYKDYQDSPFMIIDKSKLMQVLVNLIGNAKDAVLASANLDKRIILCIKLKEDLQSVEITVSDNGIGIAQHDLVKIFSLGFTTKQNGHGYGLHNCAIVTRDMGGNLQVTSKGIGQGATFVLTLPLSEAGSMEDANG